MTRIMQQMRGLRCARARHHSSRMGSRGESKGAIEAIHGTELAMPRVADANDRKTVKP